MQNKSLKTKSCFFLATILLSMLVLCGCGKETPETEMTKSDTNSQTEQIENTESSSEIEIETESQGEEETEIGNTETDSTVDREEPTETIDKPTYTFEEYSTPKTMYAKSSVNVRDIPEKTGNKLGGLSTNQEVKVLGKCNETGWYKIEYKNSIGYVSNNYLVNENVEETSPDEPSTPDTPSDVEDEEPKTPTRPIYTDISQIDTSRPYVEWACNLGGYGILYAYVPNVVLNIEGAGNIMYGDRGVDSEGNPLIGWYFIEKDENGNLIHNIQYYAYCDGTIAYTSTWNY